MSAKRTAMLVCVSSVLLAGCSAAFYTEQADEEVYGIVADKNRDAFGSDRRAFTIGPKADVLDQLRQPRPKAEAPQPAEAPPPAPAGAKAPAKQAFEAVLPAQLPTPVPEPSPDAIHLAVADALRLAVSTSRQYQTQKEGVYLACLGLTFNRYLFRPHPFASGSVDFASQYGDGRQRSWDPSATVGVSQQLADGAIVATNVGLTALKFLNRHLGDTLDSTLNFTLTQPLWRGAGRKIVQENLIQSERNALYGIRSFAKFEQDFAVDIASQYLQVLQQRDIVMNNWRNYLSLKEGRQRAEALANAERLAEFEVDQARQDELSAYNRWVVEREGYANSLDAFKITLGIPVTTEVALVPEELKRLTAQGLQHPTIDLDEATAEAMATRLDLANRRDAFDDAKRKVVVAEDGLKGDVDLVASIGYASRAEQPQSARIALSRGDYSIGFDIDLPIDRLQERNALRETQIALDASARSLDEFRDDVILAVRRAFRRLEQARESYEIQQRSVLLAEGRVESTQLLLQAGEASQRDVLEAQRALLTARNGLTGALVSHTIAGLQFQRDVGTLVVDEEGQIHGWNLTDNGR